MILSCHNISKAFGERVIVDRGSFHIEEREKAALVGVNGAGTRGGIPFAASQFLLSCLTKKILIPRKKGALPVAERLRP